MQPIIKPYIDRHGNRLTEFPILFPDGEVKPAYTLVALARLFNKEFVIENLEDYGLIRGIDFVVKNTTDLPDGVVDMNVLGNVNGKRTVISLPGLIKLVLADKNEYSDPVRSWLANVVVPKAIKANPKMSDHPVLTMFRDDVNRLALETRLQAPDIGITEVKVNSSFVSENKTTIIIVAIVAVGTATIVYIKRKRKNNSEENK